MSDVEYSELKKLWTPERERCGLILFDGTIKELENNHPDPVHSYEMNPEDFLDNAYATWHTHPVSSGNLSAEDYLNFVTPPANVMVHFIVDSELVWRYYWDDGKLLLDDHDPLPRLSEETPSGTPPRDGDHRGGGDEVLQIDPGVETRTG